MKIILGSASPRRKQILREMGYEFDVMPANIDEKAIRDTDPEKLVLKLARAKAEAIIPRLKEPAILITSDQVVSWNDRILEKPASKQEAKLFLRNYSKIAPSTVTSVVAVNTQTMESAEGVDVQKITFKTIPEEALDELISTMDSPSRAGGFAVENPLLASYVSFQGPIDSIMGLPKDLMKQLINRVF